MARGIRNLAREALELHNKDQHEEALACAITLAATNPGSALALNLVGYLHVHAGGVAWNERAPGDDAASALESYHFGAALDAFAAAARIAPNCVLTAFSHAEALAANDRYADAQRELLRVLSTATTSHADPAVNHVGYDAVGGSTKNERKYEAMHKARVFLEEVTAVINNEIVPIEAGKLLGGDAAVDQVRERAKLLSETYRYSVGAQLLPVYIELEAVRALDLALDTRRLLLHRCLALISDAVVNFDSSLLIALFHAKLLFALDQFDESEKECRRALRIETPTDPKLDAIPPAVSVPGADYESRVSSVKKQLRVLLKRIIVVAAECWSSIKSTQRSQRVDRVISLRVDTLQKYYQSAAKTISDALRFLKNQVSWSFLICPNSRCDGKKFVDTESLWQHMSNKHRDELWEKLQSVLGPDINENASKDDHSLDGITLCQDSGQHDIFQLQGVQDMFDSLLVSPSIGIRAEPFAEMRQRKCREGSEVLEHIKEKLKMLPEDTLSTEFEEFCFGIQNMWHKFLKISLLDYREVILPLERSFQWIQMKELIVLSAKDLGRIIGHANIDTIFGTSGQSVMEMGSTSSCQQSLNVFKKNNADKDLYILSLTIWSLCNLRHFRDMLLTEPLAWIPSVDNPCIAQKFYEIFSSWEKNDRNLTDVVLTYMKTLLCGIVNCTTFFEKMQAGTNFASEIVATILIGLHMSETFSHCRLNKEIPKHVVNPTTCGYCICPTHNLFGININAQMSCQCGKCSGEYLYTALFHKLDAGSPQTTKIKSFAELPVLLDEQFYKDNNCEDCGTLQNNDLVLSNTPHFFTIVLNWLGGSENQDTLSEVMSGITSPLDTAYFCKSANSSTMYTVTSMICYLMSATSALLATMRTDGSYMTLGLSRQKILGSIC
uniref:Uncharacterized protein n=1 Tax=Avena sativa TaxID=4498 RepID=A0ACD5Y5Y9_AVESA